MNDPATGRPRFTDYERLFIEPRDSEVLRPQDAFTFMQKKGIFQAGLSLCCPNCELEFWVHLDDVATETRCELCANVFLITPQLRDRDWRYRRSGLFGKDNNQEGSIPVAVTLQQLDTALHPNTIFLAAMTLAPTTAHIDACETDLVVVQQEFYSGKISVAIGECKTRVEISDEDVRNLTRVADVDIYFDPKPKR